MSSLVIRLALTAVGVYALTGFYVVGGNEKGVVRRFGKLTLPLRPSGLHYDWPYPLTKIDRINFAAVQTVAVGGTVERESPSAWGSSSRSFLTGDQNLLEVRAQVLYRPSESQIGEFLYAQSSPQLRLGHLAESILVDLLSRSGVDFAHVRGLSELNEQLTARLRIAVGEQRLGVDIEQAVIEQVDPPVRVKAEFLDVSNARAEQARSLQEARTWAEQKLAQAQSEGRRLEDDAHADRRARIAAARGAADRFRHLVAQMRDEAERSGADYESIRQLAVQRMAWQTLNDVWPKVRKKAIVEADGPVDLSVFPGSR